MMRSAAEQVVRTGAVFIAALSFACAASHGELTTGVTVAEQTRIDLLASLGELAGGARGTELVEPALQRLEVAIAALPSDDALNTIQFDAAPSPEALREAAPATSAVSEQLESALRALLTRSIPPTREVTYQRALDAFGKSFRRLDTTATLSSQMDVVTSALQAACDAVFIAADDDPPFGAVARGAGDESLSAEVALTRARVAVAALAQAHWISDGERASRAIAALAELAATLDAPGTENDDVARARLQAARLRYDDGPNFQQATWVRTGLARVLDVYDAQAVHRCLDLVTWSRAARRAISGIDEDASLGLQRAAVQDAARATVDAYAILINAAETRCPQTK